MSETVVLLALCAALLHAVWNALVKGGRDPLLVLAAITLTCAIIGAAFIPFVEAPDRASWLFIFLSLLLHGGYYVCLLQAYRVGELSHVYPLARGTAPLLVAIGSAVFAGEYLSAPAVAGVALTSFGISSLAFEKGRPWRGDHRPFMFALATSAFIAAYTIVDGTGVRLSNSALGYIVWLFALDGLGIATVAIYLRGRTIGAFLRREWALCLTGGIASALAYGFVIYAMSLGAMAIVSALRETSVIFAALIGVMFLNERVTPVRLAATTVIAAGLLLMNL